MAKKMFVGNTGTSSRNLIVNGQVVRDPHVHPYYVTLDRYGGGVLLAPDIVLTAGHTKPPSKHVRIVVGRYDIDTDTDETVQEFTPQRVVRHPQYDNAPLYDLHGDELDQYVYDVTLIKLSGRSSHPYLDINRNPNLPTNNSTVLVLGMGDTHNYASRSKVLRSVQLQTLDTALCEQTNPVYARAHLHPTHLCTTSRNHSDSCSYDSGSPILWSNDNQILVVVGLVSWGGPLCADPEYPGVNVRVASMSDWIDQTVCELSDDPPRSFRCGGTVLEGDDVRWVLPILLLLGGLVGCFYAVRRRRSHAARTNHYASVSTKIPWDTSPASTVPVSRRSSSSYGSCVSMVEVEEVVEE